jgi:hypothetical protein
MGRNCMVCGRLFGCIRGSVRYACSDCRIEDSCGIRNHFSTTRMGKEICDSCLGGEEHPEVAPSLNLAPLLRRAEVPPMNPWS